MNPGESNESYSDFLSRVKSLASQSMKSFPNDPMEHLTALHEMVATVLSYYADTIPLSRGQVHKMIVTHAEGVFTRSNEILDGYKKKDAQRANLN